MAGAAMSQAAEPDESLLIAEDGQALLPVILSDQASESTKEVAAELAEYLKQITGAAFEIAVGHGSSGIVLGTLEEFPDPALADNRAEFDAHPEYLAMVDGKRHGEQLCVSNPAVRQLAVQWAFDFLEKNPQADMVSMEPSDGEGQCECEACAELGSISDRDVEEASQLAAERPDVQARLDHIKQYLRYVHLRWMVDRATDTDERKELTLATLTHAYRTRYSYMNHWEAMRQSWAPQAAEEFDEPSWAPNDPAADPPWAVDEPYTRAETDAAFREGLSYFLPDAITEQQFSSELVPLASEGEDAAAESQQAYQGGLRYALYSVEGEPLELDVTHPII